MQRLCEMKNCLISAAQSQMSNLQNCDAEELGEVIDMIKDIEQAISYCTNFSTSAAKSYLAELTKILEALEINPFFK